MRDMQFTLEMETQIYLLSVLLGAGIGILFDFFRVFRIVCPHKKIMVFVEDLVFSFLAGFALFTFTTGLTGKIRYFTVFGMAIGFVLEHFSVGNLFVMVVRKLYGLIRRIFVTPTVNFITKIVTKIRGVFVKKCLIFDENKKNDEKPLKVDF